MHVSWHPVASRPDTERLTAGAERAGSAARGALGSRSQQSGQRDTAR